MNALAPSGLQRLDRFDSQRPSRSPSDNRRGTACPSLARSPPPTHAGVAAEPLRQPSRNRLPEPSSIAPLTHVGVAAGPPDNRRGPPTRASLKRPPTSVGAAALDYYLYTEYVILSPTSSLSSATSSSSTVPGPPPPRLRPIQDAFGFRSRRVDRPIFDRAACPPERRSRRPTSNLRPCRCCNAKTRARVLPPSRR